MASHEAAHGSPTIKQVLRIIYAASPISRADIARRLDLTRSTVTEICKPLLASGVLREASMTAANEGRNVIGRPPIGLSLVATRALFVGVNIGVRQTQIGLMGVDNETLFQEVFDTPTDSSVALTRVYASIERAFAKLPEGTPVFVGFSLPGPVDAGRTRLLCAPHLGWNDVSITKLFDFKSQPDGKFAGRATYVSIENDATASALFEARRRLPDLRSEEWKNFILVRAGTGIGVGLVRGGEVQRSVNLKGGLAGEFGHMTIVAGGKPCACGNRGCWERYASASSAAALYSGERAAGGSSKLRYVEIVARAEAGERRAQSTLEQTGNYLGIGIANLISGLGLSHIILSGRVVHGWRFIQEPLREAVRRSMAGRFADWSVEPGEATGAGLGGAVEVAVESYLDTIANEFKSMA